MTSERLLQIIKEEGVENIVFNASMRKLHNIPGFFSWTDESEEQIEVPCKIDTSQYDPFKNYKISIWSMFSSFGVRHYYIEDFVNSINRGDISIRGQLKITKRRD